MKYKDLEYIFTGIDGYKGCHLVWTSDVINFLDKYHDKDIKDIRDMFLHLLEEQKTKGGKILDNKAKPK